MAAGIMREPFYTRHRGPFRLCVARPYATKPGHVRTTWLPGSLEGEDVETEARALLTDPRDRIDCVDVWSERDQQFVHTIRKADV